MKQTSLFIVLGLVSGLSGNHCEGFRKDMYAWESEQDLTASSGLRLGLQYCIMMTT